jgi:hypothetical protein
MEGEYMWPSNFTAKTLGGLPSFVIHRSQLFCIEYHFNKFEYLDHTATADGYFVDLLSRNVKKYRKFELHS